MEEGEDQESHHVLSLLEALQTTSKHLQSNPIPTIYNNNDINATIEALLELKTKADPILSTDPSLFHLSQLLSNLKTLLGKLENLQGHGLRSLLRRQVANYKISQVGHAMEAEIQAYIDQKSVQSAVKALKESAVDEERVNGLMVLEKRLSQGFDRDYQELILRAKVFSILELMLCDSTCSSWVRDQAALVVLALVQFNRDVFVGLVMMGPSVNALVSMGSCCSIEVLSSLVRIIRTPLVDEINGEIPRIINLLSSEEDMSIRVAAMNCILEIAFLGREEVIDSMLGQCLIERLMGLQRMESQEEKFPFSRCVAGFAVQVEVGEGLEKSERRAFKLEILKRVRETSVSDAEAASVVAEVLWGSSP